jgi:hypothetical protein
MKPTCMLVMSGVLCAILLPAAAARGADATPSVVTNLSGSLHIVQDVPCDVVDLMTPVTGGRLELTPAEGISVSGGRLFGLTSAQVSFGAFSASGSCLTFTETRNYSAVSVQFGRAVAFTAIESSPNVFSFTIPRDLVWIYEAAIVDGNSEDKHQKPSQDVTGTIDLAAGTFSIHVVTTQTIHFQEGCTIFGCLIDEQDDGTNIADVSGSIAFPDADHDGVPDRDDNCRFTANASQSPVPTPAVFAPADVTLASCLDHTIGWAVGADICDGGPTTITNNAPLQFLPGANTVTWTAHDSKNRIGTDTQIVTINDVTPPTAACTTTNPVGTSFVVTGYDDCGVMLTLGSYTIGNGEQIKIQETGQPGVRLQNVVSGDGIRKFLVGKGQAVILATDGAANTSTAACQYPQK